MLQTVLVVGALALVACDQGSTKAKVSDADNILVHLRKLERLMCACQDEDCAKRVGDEMTQWSEQFRSPHARQVKETNEETEINAAILKCWTQELAPKWFTLEPNHGPASGATSIKLSASSQFVDSDAKTAKIYFGGRRGKVTRVIDSEELLVDAPDGTAGETVDVVLELEGNERQSREEVPHAFRYLDATPRAR